MKIFIIFLFLTAGSLGTTFAQVDDSLERLKDFNVSASKNEVRKKALIESISKMMENVKSFEYISERNKPADIVYEKLLWKEMDSYFYYEIVFINRNESSVIQRSVSFIENQTFTLFPSERELHSKKGKTTLSSVEVFPTPLMAYSFLSTKGFYLTLENAREAIVDATFSNRIFYQREELLDGNDYSVFRILSVYDFELREYLTHEIYIAKTMASYPLIWKAYDSENVMVKRFDSVETGSHAAGGGLFHYPKKYSLWQSKYRGKITGPKGVVKYFPFKSSGLFPRVLINHLDATDLYIDPMLADYIFDVDTGKIIKIPK